MNQYKEKRLLGKLLLNKMCFNMGLFKVFHLKLLKNKSVQQYLEETNSLIKYENKSSYMRCRVPAFDENEYENWETPRYQNEKVSPRYVGVIEDVCVFSELEGIIKDGYFLNDRVLWDEAGMPLYPGNTIIAMSGEYSLQRKRSINRNIDKAIFLLKNFSDNIFHYTIEVLTRLIEIDKYEEYRNYPLLLDQQISEDYRNIQLLESVNIYKHDIFWINYNDAVAVDELIIPPINAWVAMDLKVRQKDMLGWMIYPEPLQIIKKLVLSKKKERKIYDKVYIARGNNDRLINESEIIQHLKKLDFDIFYPDKGDFWDEVSCFCTANTIISCAGAALTNLVYSKESVNVFIICPFKLQSVSYTSVTDAMNINSVHMINAKFYKEGESINQSKLIVELEELDNAIKKEDIKKL